MSTVSAEAARPPSVRESQEFALALNAIRKLPQYSQALTKLSTMMTEGVLQVEDSWPDGLNGQTSFPVIGKQKITINARIIPDAGDAMYRTRFGADALWEDRTWLASILVHEYLHTTQSFWEARMGPGRVEPAAWKYQLGYVRATCTALPPETSQGVKSRCESLEERVQSELDLYGIRFSR